VARGGGEREEAPADENRGSHARVGAVARSLHRFSGRRGVECRLTRSAPRSANSASGTRDRATRDAGDAFARDGTCI